MSGLAAVLFRWIISFLQEFFYQADEQSLILQTHSTNWLWFLLIPMLGGLGVGVILHLFSDQDRNGSVADVIEGPLSAFCPGSVLQNHENATIVLDRLAASDLKLYDYYLQTEKMKSKYNC